MAEVGLALIVIGGIVSAVGGIWFLVVAFRESVLWGLGVWFVPFVNIIFLVMFWSDAAKPFGISLLGVILIFIGVFVGASAEAALIV